MQNKKDLRIWAKNLRKNLDIDLISKKIVRIFINSDYYKKANNIAIYYPYGSEINFKSVFLDKTKNFFLPKITDDNNMNFHIYEGENNLVKNKFGILEPNSPIVNPNNIDLIVIPALMADKQGYRLGYGGGYYDKFLTKYTLKIPKIILLPSELFVENIPYESFDISADIIMTENEIYKIQTERI